MLETAGGRVYGFGSDFETQQAALLVSDDGRRSWRELGNVGAQPAAFESASADELYVALHDGTVKRSNDGGASWSVHLTP